MQFSLALVDQLKLLILFSVIITPLETDSDDVFAMFVQIHNETCSSSNADGILVVDSNPDNKKSASCCGYCDTSPSCIDRGSCCLGQYGSFDAARLAVTNTRYKCVSPHIFNAAGVTGSKFTTTSDNVWMVTNCTFGKEIDKVYYEKCTSLDTDDYFNSVVPVTVNNVTYRNKFCAYCNGVDETQQMRHWDIEIHCSSSISPTDNDIYNQIVERNCSLYFRIQDIYKQECIIPEYKISVCNTTGLWPAYHKDTELACQSFVDPFNQTYQNYFCYVCNTDQPKTSANWNCPSLGDQTAEITPPFIALINLDAVQQWREDKQLDCNIVNQFKDKKKMICRDIECSTGLTLMGQKCVRDYTGDVDLNLCYLVKVAIKLIPKDNSIVFDSDQQDETLPFDILFAFQPVTAKFAYLKNFVIFKKSNLLNRRAVVEYFIIDIEMEFTLDWYDTLLSVILYSHNVTIDVHGTNETKHFSSELVHVSYNETDANVSTLYFTGRNDENADRLTRFFQLYDVPRQRNCTDVGFHKLYFCPFLKVDIREMSIQYENGFLVVKESVPNVVLSKWQYSVRNDNIILCVEDFRSIYDTLTWSELPSSIYKYEAISTSRIVSFVCVCISIVCLCVTICTYVSIPTLHTQPGINNVILCVSLLLAQTFYQFGAGQRSLSYVACSVIGALCHFFWLCVMFSMNACSIQMFTIFRNRIRLSSTFSWKSTGRTVLYVVGLSAGFVIINLGVSLLTSKGENTGYVGNICYLSDSLMHLITFIIPMVVTISVNILLFTYVVFVIQKSSGSASFLNQDRNYFGVYARLSTLTGLTWIFGYIYIFFESKIIEYIFIICNGCQGVFIMLAFVLKRKTFSFLRRRLAKEKTDTISTKLSKTLS